MLALPINSPAQMLPPVPLEVGAVIIRKGNQTTLVSPAVVKALLDLEGYNDKESRRLELWHAPKCQVPRTDLYSTLCDFLHNP